MSVMSTMALGESFQTGAVLSWAIPIGLLLAVVAWWSISLTRRAFAERGDR